MERKDTEIIMQALETAYPQFYSKKSEDDRRAALRLWHEMFSEDGGVEVGAAVKSFIATDTVGFPPSIGQIKERLVKLKNPDMLDEAQAWALVSKAIQKSAYHAAEEFEKLPPVVQKVVGSPTMLRTWALTDGDDLQTVVASNFQRAYRVRAREAKEYLALPSDIRKILDGGAGVQQLHAPPDPEAQKQRAIAALLESREQTQRDMLGDEFDRCKKEDWIRDL